MDSLQSILEEIHSVIIVIEEEDIIIVIILSYQNFYIYNQFLKYSPILKSLFSDDEYRLP